MDTGLRIRSSQKTKIVGAMKLPKGTVRRGMKRLAPADRGMEKHSGNGRKRGGEAGGRQRRGPSQAPATAASFTSPSPSPSMPPEPGNRRPSGERRPRRR